MPLDRRSTAAVVLGAALCPWSGAGCSRASAEPAAPSADTILVGGTIVTVDERGSVAEALAIRHGRILAVGSRKEIEALAGPATRRIDIGGLTATPGLIDAHAHFGGGGVDLLRVADLSYPAVKSVAELAARVRERAAATPAGGWILGRGWDEGKLAERRYVNAKDLDAAAANHPVWLTHTTGHYGVANSAALALAGIGRATTDPEGGTIDRAADGSPSGVLKESAQRLVTRLIPDETPEEIDAGIRRIAAEFNKEGMTGVKDPGIGLDMWSGYQRVHAAGDLSVRVFALWRPERTVEAARTLVERIGPFSKPYLTTGDDRLISGGVKLAIDGSGGARTAWLYDEWSKDFTGTDTGNRGYPLLDPKVLHEQIRLAHDAGLHVSVHSIGDQAIDWVVDSYVEALQAKPTRGLRHGIIHANIPSERALDAIARLQRDHDAGYPEPSATFMWWIGDTYAGNFGRTRALRLNPFRTFLDKGIRWAGSSDFSVTPFAARYGIWASMARETLLGVHGRTPFGTREAVDADAALRSFTIWAARQLFLEKKVGSLEAGKYADIAVWDKNPLEAPAAAVKEMKCQLTLLGGEVVYERAAPGVPLPGARKP